MNNIFFLIPFLAVISFGIYQDSFALESYRGYDYLEVAYPNGTHTWTGGLPPWILNVNTGEYQPFIQNGNQILTNHGSVILNADGTYSFYKKGIIDDTPLFTDRIVAKYADVSNLNSWTYPNTLNNDVPDISWDGTAYVSSKIKSGIGQLDYKYILSDGKWKTQLEATNLSSLTTKAFGFDQIIDLNSDTIRFGGITRNLDNFNNTVFDKTFLENNKGKVLDFLNDISFDFDLGFENLHSITVIDTGENKSRLIFDYRTSTPLLPNETLIIDPTFGPTNGTGKGAYKTTECTSAALDAGAGYVGSDADACYRFGAYWDITTIPDTATITDTDITYTIAAIFTPTGSCKFNSYEGTMSSDSVATRFTDIGDGTTFATSADCQALGTYTQDLGASGDADLDAELGVDNEWAIGLQSTNESTAGGNNLSQFTSTTIKLTVTYTVANPPDAVDDLTYTAIGSNSVDLDWTAPSAGGGNQVIIGYQINMTTPWTSNPLVYVNDTGNTNTDYAVSGLTFGTDYSFRVSAWGNNTGGHPFNNATGNVLNVTTTTTTYSTPPTSLVASAESATQIDLDWVAPAGMSNINGYRIQRETPIGTGWNTIVSNSTNTNQYYNNTGLTTNIIYNYRVYAMNGSGISTPSNTYSMTTFHLPDAVDDLSGTATDLSTIILSWSAPTSYAPAITGYMINGTTPTGEPVDILNANTGTSATTATALNLLIGQEYSFRVSAITVHGKNATGNIWNGSTIQTFVIGNLSNPDIENTNDFSIFFDRTDLNSTAIQLNVTYPNSYNVSCDFSYKYARTNQTYSGLSTVPDGTDDQTATFTLINATGDLVQVRCWDPATGDESTYVITITDFPFLEQVRSLRNGDYGTFFQIGAFDGVMLIVIFLGMIGLNRTTPIVGIVFVVITTLVMSYFELITYPVIMYPALIMMIVWAFVTTRKDD